jgi:hypothetical protein
MRVGVPVSRALGTRRADGLCAESQLANQNGLDFLCIFPLTTFESGFARERRRPAERAPRVRPCARRRAFGSDASKTHPGPWRHARSIPGPRKVAAYIVGMEPTRSLEQLTDGELLLRLADILRQSRRSEADLVAHIGEVDARRLYAREASPSMFGYCTERLHLSEAEAYLRIAAARAAREHPILLAMLADGRLHLTAIAKLAPHLTPDNREAVLMRATHCSKRQVEEFVAELAPRPDAPALIRKLPERPPIPASPTSGRPRADRIAGSSVELRPGAAAPHFEGGHAVAPSEPGVGRDEATASSAELRLDGVRHVRVVPAAAPLAASPAAPPASVQPLSPGRYRVQFTASAGLRDKLERLQALLRSSVPGADLAAVIEDAVTEKLERLEARRFGLTTAPRKNLSQTETKPASRHIPAAVRRAVHERDGGRCRFVDEQGRRCTARHNLEFHHRHPVAMGGDHSPQGIALACKAHNMFLAEVDFGRAAMARHRRSSTGPPGPRRQAGDAAGEP